MNVTTEQGAQAQEERQRQLVLVNDVVHEVIRLGGERPTNSVGYTKTQKLELQDALLGQWWTRSTADSARQHVATQGTCEPRHERCVQVSACHADQWSRRCRSSGNSRVLGTLSKTLLLCTILVRKPDPWHSFKSSYISIWVKSQLVSQIV